jgi:hypothetical protein
VIELDPTRLTAVVDMVLEDNVAVPALVISDGATIVQLLSTDPDTATRAAGRIADAALGLIDVFRKIDQG